LKLGYTESRGDPLLLKEISGMYESVVCEGAMAPILCAPQEGVLLAMQAMLGSRGTVVCMSPTYQSLHEIARSLGCDILVWGPETNEEGLPLRYSIDTLNQLIAAHQMNGGKAIEAIVVNFPHNPTGSILSRDEFLQLVDTCRKLDAYMFSDEM
jgi:aspartate/methionine/tyrosine aminotransferase